MQGIVGAGDTIDTAVLQSVELLHLQEHYRCRGIIGAGVLMVPLTLRPFSTSRLMRMKARAADRFSIKVAWKCQMSRCWNVRV